MPIHLHRDLEAISRKVIEVGSLVEDSVAKCIEAVSLGRRDLAEAVIEQDRRIDVAEVDVEEEALKALALHQPVAGDLRYIVSVLKLNNDLERMGDLAANIASRALEMRSGGRLPVDVDLAGMGARVREMVRGCLDALVMRSAGYARRVLAQDDRVDEEHANNYRMLLACMREHSDRVEDAARVLSISKALERIADLATNVAEDVIFLVEGEVVRHRIAWAREDETGAVGEA